MRPLTFVLSHPFLIPPKNTQKPAAGAFLAKKPFQVFPQAWGHFFYHDFHLGCDAEPEKPLSCRIRTAAATNSALDAATEPSGKIFTSSRPIRVENPDANARRSNGQAEASAPCNRIRLATRALRSIDRISSATT